MDKFLDQKSDGPILYPPIDPFAHHMIDTGDGHQIYVEECGVKGGRPVVVFHGGPGAGCSPSMRRYFDPTKYHIILFDQRGCGRSRPTASVKNNTPQHLINDIEHIRTMLKIERWMVFGGSWGATLALLYAQAHPQHVTHMVLRGIFMMTRDELDWFYGGGAGKFWPDLWAKFESAIPVGERDDLISAYHKRLFSGDLRTEMNFGKLWSDWENALASFRANGNGGYCPVDYARTFARIENHYFINRGFLRSDDQIMEDLDKIKHIPAYIVQGRYDFICPPHTAHRLAKAWPMCDLHLVPFAGHAMSEPGISEKLLSITDMIGRQSER
jgi:proline iminopeptidase